jgi:hypothetical protein
MTKKTILFIAIFILTILISGVNVQANYQSRPDVTPKTNVNADTFFVNTRKIEEAGQGMGLASVIDGNGNKTSGATGIDVHMMKNTEWGAVAILAASSYGQIDQNTQIGLAKSSTTGNKYGVFQMNDTTGEFVAGINDVVATNHGNLGKIKSAPARYRDIYTGAIGNVTSKIGDGTGGLPYGTQDWMGAQYKLGLGNLSKLSMIRGYGAVNATQNSIFSFVSSLGGFNGEYDSGNLIAAGEGSWANVRKDKAGRAEPNVSTRAAVVCAPRTLIYGK